MQAHSLTKGRKAPVLMVPSSASTSKQWDELAKSLPDFPIVRFELYGHVAWDAEAKPLSLAQEAARILDAVHEDASIHLIGHSYGGGVALKFASLFPGRVQSLTLIEPSCFHLLRQSGLYPNLLDEIEEIAAKVTGGLQRGDRYSSMHLFIDYWCGAGTWGSFTEDRQTKFARLAVYADQHFKALFEETATLEDYAQVRAPTLIVCGTQSPEPSRLLSRLINEAMPSARHATIPWAGHMSPMTHPNEVSKLIGEHLTRVEKAMGAQPHLAEKTGGAHTEHVSKETAVADQDKSLAA